MKKFERGGLVLGLILGLLVGLALALGVALWVTKAPVPFVNKVPQRTADQDAAEAERNKNWDPNAPLAGKPAPARAASAPPVAAAPADAPSTPAAAKTPARDPAAILAGAPVPAAPASTAAPAKSAKSVADPFIYFVQAGAFQNSDDAEQRRAKLAMLGLESKLVEREQSGRTVFRVRIGPFDKQADADATKDKLAESGIEAVLVRIDRPAR